MEKKLKVRCPMVPNFILIENSDTPISIREFTEDELREIASEWTEELIKKSKSK